MALQSVSATAYQLLHQFNADDRQQLRIGIQKNIPLHLQRRKLCRPNIKEHISKLGATYAIVAYENVHLLQTLEVLFYHYPRRSRWWAWCRFTIDATTLFAGPWGRSFRATNFPLRNVQEFLIPKTFRFQKTGNPFGAQGINFFHRQAFRRLIQKAFICGEKPLL